ncbi:hypothetical protein MiSe_59670 [Microseira wollei NIES-4236]|uniref:Uncharacterized protein n=1 Tax=Microseira wollei NIES-4236 TaxID=2530354 RepID=A0AAV3XLW6_9CYAN|nr:hypothetical protein MiSe_59670 [Microseira wollei NIES-4236]
MLHKPKIVQMDKATAANIQDLQQLGTEAAE